MSTTATRKPLVNDGDTDVQDAGLYLAVITFRHVAGQQWYTVELCTRTTRRAEDGWLATYVDLNAAQSEQDRMVRVFAGQVTVAQIEAAYVAAQDTVWSASKTYSNASADARRAAVHNLDELRTLARAQADYDLITRFAVAA